MDISGSKPDGFGKAIHILCKFYVSTAPEKLHVFHQSGSALHRATDILDLRVDISITALSPLIGSEDDSWFKLPGIGKERLYGETCLSGGSRHRPVRCRQSPQALRTR